MSTQNKLYGAAQAASSVSYLAWAPNTKSAGEDPIPEHSLLQVECKKLSDECKNLSLLNKIYKKALSRSSDGLVIAGPDGRIIEINDTFCRYLGIDPDQATGKDINYFFDGKLPEAVESGAGAPFANGEGSGRSGPMALVRRPITVNGRTVAWVAVARLPRRSAGKDRGQEDSQPIAAASLGTSQAFDELPTKNGRYAEVKRLAARFAASELPILLCGETGVGKDVFANAIHQASRRANHPLVCVNCASIPAELLESELFGYVDGAFTGSRRMGKKGKFEMADHGTLFLDEVGEMPLQMQCKLLRILQSQEVEKLGAETPVRVNVRVIAATNKNLSQSIRSGTFRADLYYRLNVLPISIPALRERKEDIADLAQLFLSELVSSSGRKATFARATLGMLEKYDWPGNVRELRNVIGCAFMTTEGKEILPEHLLITAHETFQPAEGRTVTIEDVRCHTERELILNCLRKYDGNFPRAAKALGIHRSTLYSRLHKMGISIEEFR